MLHQLGIKIKTKKVKAEDDLQNDNLLLDAPVGDGKLSLGDLFQSIDQSKMQTSAADVINTNKLEKQLKKLRKDVQTSALAMPLTGRKRMQIERDENYQ